MSEETELQQLKDKVKKLQSDRTKLKATVKELKEQNAELEAKASSNEVVEKVVVKTVHANDDRLEKAKELWAVVKRTHVQRADNAVNELDQCLR